MSTSAEQILRRRIAQSLRPLPPCSPATEDPASAAFDRCVDRLAFLVRALRAASHLPYSPVTRERLPFAVHALTGNLVGPEAEWSEFLFLAHLHAPGPILPSALTEAQLTDVQAN